jgi:hypothetical protein
VCGATKADKLLQTVTSFAKREFNCVYRGVCRDQYWSSAEIPHYT